MKLALKQIIHPVMVETPIGIRKVRPSQVSRDGSYLKVKDIEGQFHWALINQIGIDEEDGGKLFAELSVTGETYKSILLAPTTFLD